MKAKDFQKMLEQFKKLTLRQKKRLMNDFRHNEQQAEGSVLVESRLKNDKPVCPHCSGEAARWGSASGLQRYRCQSCHKTFNALTGTPLARLRHKDKWLTYTQQMAEGNSIRKSAEACAIHRNTSFHWRHRFLTLPNGPKSIEAGWHCRSG